MKFNTIVKKSVYDIVCAYILISLIEYSYHYRDHNYIENFKSSHHDFSDKLTFESYNVSFEETGDEDVTLNGTNFVLTWDRYVVIAMFVVYLAPDLRKITIYAVMAVLHVFMFNVVHSFAHSTDITLITPISISYNSSYYLSRRYPLFAHIAKAHHMHHVCLGKCNYNIGFPMFDYIFGTYVQPNTFVEKAFLVNKTIIKLYL